MKVKLIVAFADNTWDDKTVTVPDDVVPEKYHRGSTKWNKTVVKWASENAKLMGKKDCEIEYVDVLDANPE